jgi:hypothetical protein
MRAHNTLFNYIYATLNLNILRIKNMKFLSFFSPRATDTRWFFFQKRAQLIFKLKKRVFFGFNLSNAFLKKFCAGSCFIYMMLINFLVLIFFSFLSFLRFFNGPKSKEYISTSFFSFFALLFFKGLLKIFDGISYNFL